MEYGASTTWIMFAGYVPLLLPVGTCRLIIEGFLLEWLIKPLIEEASPT
jgi:hypothetical protein